MKPNSCICQETQLLTEHDSTCILASGVHNLWHLRTRLYISISVCSGIIKCFHAISYCRCFPERRTMERHRHGARGEEFDYPPMDHGGFSPSPRPPPWLEPPPPYEVAIKTTCSSTHLRRAYSDTHLATEPLFGQSREISFEVWRWTMGTSHHKMKRHETGASTQTLH